MPIAAGIYYAKFDEGRKDEPPIILIHGAGSNHLVWPADIRRLAGQRVFAIDLPGHGRSSGVAQQTISAYADRIIDFLTALGLYQAVFVGHSMGGAIALDLAVRYPDQAAGLGLIATGAYLGVDPDFLENLSHPVMSSTALHQFQTRAFGSQVSPAQVETIMQSMKEVRSSVLYGDWRACADFDVRESVGHIEAPTWIISGSEDRLTPIAFAHFLAERLPAARLQIIPGAGHMVPVERPERVAQGLNQFLGALSEARYAAARVHLPNPAVVARYEEKYHDR